VNFVREAILARLRSLGFRVAGVMAAFLLILGSLISIDAKFRPDDSPRKRPCPDEPPRP
jgi:hypothetical protein